MTLSLEQLNTASPQEAMQLLDGLYEHSPWIAEARSSTDLLRLGRT